jgi:hypothetical protein
MTKHIFNLGDDCLACHDDTGTLVNFDHAVTQFPLVGMHNQIQCMDCHTNGGFNEMPYECHTCHPEPKIHAGLFSTNCKACHTTIDWAALVSLDGQMFDHFEHTKFSLDRHQINHVTQPMVCTDVIHLQMALKLRSIYCSV